LCGLRAVLEFLNFATEFGILATEGLRLLLALPQLFEELCYVLLSEFGLLPFDIILCFSRP
jgi:hypothetical protein